MKKLLFFSLLILGLVFLYSENTSDKYKLVKLWESEPVFQTPESVYYDTVRSICYVSNIAGQPAIKDGNGFISKLNLNGSIETLKWITDLNAPKGMCVHNDKLYVTDIDELVEIDIEKSIVLMRSRINGAKFLNDITVDKNGVLYFSDTSNNCIYTKNNEVSIWLDDKIVSKPNGIFAEDTYLVLGNSRFLEACDLKGNKIKIIADYGKGIDGIAADGKGNYFISDWSGNTSLVFPKGEILQLLDTSKQNINAADLCYITEKNILLIPTFFDNRVIAYKLIKD